MSLTPVKLHQNNRFETIRSATGAVAADATNPPTDAFIDGLTGVQLFDSAGSENLIFYWTANTLAGATLDLELYIRDGLAPGGPAWKRAAVLATVAADQLQKLQVHGATMCFVAVAAVTGVTTETDLTIRAFTQRD